MNDAEPRPTGGEPNCPSGPDDMGARIAALERERDDALARVQLEREVLNTMTHELRTPMNGVFGMTQLLLESALDREQRGMVEVIHRSSQALIALINDSLDFARLDSGKVEIEVIDFDLRVAVSEIAALLAPLANDKGLAMEFRVHHEVPSRLRGDPGRIRQVLLNLAGNAIKFTSAGSVVIRVDRLAEDDSGVRLRFAVFDTGIGITAEQRTRLFQAFEQADATIARRFGGTGLGLAVSRRLVMMMGGEIGLDSEPGSGSTFWFTLPLATQPEADATTAPPMALEGVRVLLADASRAMRGLVAERLGQWGCEVGEAESLGEALDELRRGACSDRPYRIALIDRFLEGGGDQLGAAIRADRSLDNTHMVLMTSVGRRGEAAEARARGFAAYLTKPLEWDHLAEALAEVLRQPTGGGSRVFVTRHSLAEARRSRVRILIVEDNAVNQLVTKWALQRLGATVEIAGSGAEGLEACANQDYAIVISDLQMPDMDGYAFARALRAREAERGRPRTPVVALSGSTAADEQQLCFEAGMDAFLHKPVDLAKLSECVQQLTDTERGAAGEHPERQADGAPAAQDGDGASADRLELERDEPRGAAAQAVAMPLDLARLEEMSMGIPRLRDALLDTFLNEVHPRLERLRHAFGAAEAARVEFEAHGLMGMSGTIGAMACFEVFSQLEQAARERSLVSLAPVLSQAYVEVERAERYITHLDREQLAA
jgi:CheY-like chemotaxis protein/nitrogen-specific signal transduction histidine kinase/HPt (histidine-containing phosphotransfer) domain-containing protein